MRVRASSTEKGESKDKVEDDKSSFNPFGFVTDNPSSRSAIQLPESPAEDGNVGQMIYVIFCLCFLILIFQCFLF